MPPRDFQGLIYFFIHSIIDPLVILTFSAALLYFLYGVLKYVQHADDPKERAEGVKMMSYGIVALFVMVSVWGLVGILSGTFNFTNIAPPIPKF